MNCSGDCGVAKLHRATIRATLNSSDR